MVSVERKERGKSLKIGNPLRSRDDVTEKPVHALIFGSHWTPQKLCQLDDDQIEVTVRVSRQLILYSSYEEDILSKWVIKKVFKWLVQASPLPGVQAFLSPAR